MCLFLHGLPREKAGKRAKIEEELQFSVRLHALDAGHAHDIGLPAVGILGAARRLVGDRKPLVGVPK